MRIVVVSHKIKNYKTSFTKGRPCMGSKCVLNQIICVLVWKRGSRHGKLFTKTNNKFYPLVCICIHTSLFFTFFLHFFLGWSSDVFVSCVRWGCEIFRYLVILTNGIKGENLFTSMRRNTFTIRLYYRKAIALNHELS